MEKVKVDKVEVEARVEWICPNCNFLNKLSYSPGPYQAIADSPPEEMCHNCEEFFELTFYT